MPILVAGRGGGVVQAGQHLRVPDRTPITNLYRALITTVGAHSETIGDSTGQLDALFAPA